MTLSVLERIAASFWPSLTVAMLGLASYFAVDKVREFLRTKCECRYSSARYEGLYRRWYFKRVPLAAASASSTVALGAMVTFLTTLDAELVPMAYSTFLLCFLGYWLINVSAIAVTVMNSNCTLQLRVFSFVVQVLPLVTLVVAAALPLMKRHQPFA